MHLSPQHLIQLIRESSWGVPVRDMEALLHLGGEAVDALLSFFDSVDVSMENPQSLFWLLVTLGEMREPRALPHFEKIIKESHDLELICVAMEGLAKAGPIAIRSLAGMISGGADERVRIFSYAGLSRMKNKDGWLLLERALTDDPHCDFAAARALSERGSERDQVLIHGVYVKAQGWKKATLEMILTGMMTGRLPWSLGYTNWRIRYRRTPRGGLQIPMDWPMVFSLLWESRTELKPSREPDTLSLEQLRESARLMEHDLVCEDCGEPLRSPTGIPLCKEVEEDLILYQLEKIRAWRADRWDYIHEVLDQLDYKELDAIQFPEETDEQRRVKGEALDAIDVVRRTLYWMVEQGLETLAQGEQRLLEALSRVRAGKQKQDPHESP
jgi:hypothetical protein